jgi:hypothetical protein
MPPSKSNAGEPQDFPRGMLWLARPLASAGRTVLDGLDLARLTDSDLRDISLRMEVIFDTIEMPRCEGRLMPRDIFDRMDTLASMVLHGHGGMPRLADWAGLISDFGEYYDLAGEGPIAVEETYYHEHATRYAS